MILSQWNTPIGQLKPAFLSIIEEAHYQSQEVEVLCVHHLSLFIHVLFQDGGGTMCIIGGASAKGEEEEEEEEEEEKLRVR